MFQDSTGKPIHTGNRVRFRGQEYTIKEFLMGGGHSRIAAIKFEEDQHTLEVADEWSVDLVED